jgi:hypothetical protein
VLPYAIRKRFLSFLRLLEHSFVGHLDLFIFDRITDRKNGGSAWATEIRGHCHPLTLEIGHLGSKISFTSERKKNFLIFRTPLFPNWIGALMESSYSIT